MSQPDDPFTHLPPPRCGEPRAEVARAIRRQCTRDLCQGKRLSCPKRVLLSLLLSFTAVGALVALGLRRNPAGLAVGTVLFGLIVWSLVLAIVLVVGLGRPPGRRIARAWRLLLAVGVPLAFLAYLTVESSGSVALAEFVRGKHADGALFCGAHTFLFSGLISAGVLLLWRGTDPLSPGLSGALAGVVGGLSGAMGMGVACPNGEAWHLWCAHGSAVVALSGIGWLVGRRWLAP
ncbi:MAG TPA: NrsF family protein [Polyangiaceae bacterium]|nr:NrsF family protein [Polyangiaceae bacterium]